MAFDSIATTARGEMLKLIAPTTGADQGTRAVDTQEAVEEKCRALRNSGYRFLELGPAKRARLLRDACRILARDGSRFVDVVVRETGKPEVEAWTEVLAAAEALRYYAQQSPAWQKPDERKAREPWFRTRRIVEHLHPVGVYGYVSSFDMPLLLPIKMIAQLLCGANVVLWKPSEHVTGVAAEIQAIFDRVGPKDIRVLETVYGADAVGAAVLGAYGEGLIDEVVFTGRREASPAIMSKAVGRMGDPILGLEGNNPMIVLRDADVEIAAAAAVTGAFLGAGQSCISLKRFFVQREVHERFVAEVVRLSEQLRVGPGEAGDAEVGPMISTGLRERARAAIEEALAAGAERVHATAAQAGCEAGFFQEPTVLTGCDGEMDLFKCEVLGPVLPVQMFDSYEEAVGLANEGDFGLAAVVFGRDPDVTTRISRSVLAGVTAVNDGCWFLFDPTICVHAMKASGRAPLFGREGFERTIRRRSTLVHGHGIARDRGRFFWLPQGSMRVRRLKSMVRARFGEGFARFSPGILALEQWMGSRKPKGALEPEKESF